jgi:hypothetical protein
MRKQGKSSLPRCRPLAQISSETLFRPAPIASGVIVIARAEHFQLAHRNMAEFGRQRTSASVCDIHSAFLGRHHTCPDDPSVSRSKLNRPRKAWTISEENGPLVSAS